MYRMLIGLAVVVILVVVGSILAVVYLGGGSADVAEPDGPPVADQPAGQPVEEPSKPVPAVLPEVTVKPKAEPEADAPKPEVPEPEPVVVDPPADADVKTRIAALLDSLSGEEVGELGRQLGERRRREWQERRRRMLPSDGRLQMLRWRRDDNLRLNEAQEQKIVELRAIMNPKIEVSLQDIWAQEEELTQQVRTLYSEGRQDEARAIQEQLRDLRTQSNAAKAQLDVEYTQLLGSVLTPDQMAEINRMGQRGQGSGRRGRSTR